MIAFRIRSFLFHTFFIALLAFPLWVSASTVVFINELHYDNSGTDTGEAVEVAGPAGTDLGGWRLDFYNGSNGEIYKTTNLTGILSDTANGMGFSSFNVSGLQNGAEGLALIDDTEAVIQFLSYEGSFTAQEGVALGMVSTDIGVNENSALVGDSLHLVGLGRGYEDFTWLGPTSNSFGSLNAEQSIASVPLPAALPLFLVGLGGLSIFGFKQRQSVLRWPV